MGELNGSWAQPDIRDEVIGYVRIWANKTELNPNTLVGWIGIPRSMYYQKTGQVGPGLKLNRKTD